VADLGRYLRLNDECILRLRSFANSAFFLVPDLLLAGDPFKSVAICGSYLLSESGVLAGCIRDVSSYAYY
jgi:hypothetical protein